jgi:hypothetical protein
MPRQLMAKFNCSRCKREWFKEFKDGEKLHDPPSLSLCLTVADATPEDLLVFTDAKGAAPATQLFVNFDELCEECARTVKKYCKLIAKVLKSKSPQRGAKKEAAGAASPRGPTPPSSPSTRTSRGGSTSG